MIYIRFINQRSGAESILPLTQIIYASPRLGLQIADGSWIYSNHAEQVYIRFIDLLLTLNIAGLPSSLMWEINYTSEK
jgi:hypothetical protein